MKDIYKKLSNEIDNKYTYEYSMQQAIDNGFLCRYKYYPHVVRLTNEEMVRKSEKNIMSLMMTLKQLRIVEVFTQILIGVGIALTISSFFILTKINQKVVFTIIGLFIWIFGLFFKVKIRKTINQLEN